MITIGEYLELEIKNAILFTNTRHYCSDFASQLEKENPSAVDFSKMLYFVFIGRNSLDDILLISATVIMIILSKARQSMAIVLNRKV